MWFDLTNDPGTYKVTLSWLDPEVRSSTKGLLSCKMLSPMLKKGKSRWLPQVPDLSQLITELKIRYLSFSRIENLITEL